MAVDGDDTFVGRALVEVGEYSWAEVQLLGGLLRPASVVVEAGAHIGAITVPLARKCARVIAFEPQRLVHQMLCANLVLNGVVNVWAVQAALGAEDAQIMCPLPAMEGFQNTGGVSLAGAKDGELVVCRKVDTLGLPRVDLIKADVEEMELEVLKGARETIRRDRPVLYLESNIGTDQLLSELDGLGYSAFWHFPPILTEKRQGEDRLVISFNLLCLPIEADQAPAAGLERARVGDVGLDVAERQRTERLAA
jgi:FkbM family methyltransferase